MLIFHSANYQFVTATYKTVEVLKAIYDNEDPTLPGVDVTLIFKAEVAKTGGSFFYYPNDKPRSQYETLCYDKMWF